MICRGSEVNATRAIGDQSDQTTEHERTEVETRGEADAKRRCDARRRDIDRDAKPPQSPERRQKHPTTPRDLARCERSHSNSTRSPIFRASIAGYTTAHHLTTIQQQHTTNTH